MALVRLLWAFWLMSSFHVGSAAAHLFCLYQTYSGGFCWKSKKAHDFLCVRGLFLGKTYTILGCYKQHVFLKTCTELKASIQKKKKSHIFLFLPALMSHSTEEKPRLSKKGEFAFDGASELGEQSLLGVSLSVSLWAPVSFVFRMVKRNFFLKDTSALHLIQPSNIFCPLCGCNFGFDWERKKKKPSLQRILNSLLTPQVYFSIAHRDDKSIIFSSALFSVSRDLFRVVPVTPLRSWNETQEPLDQVWGYVCRQSASPCGELPL